MAKTDVISMDENVWRRFPPDLFVNLAARLPFKSLLRFRTVSKQWNNIPRNLRFQELRPSLYREFIDYLAEKFVHCALQFCRDGFLILTDWRRAGYVCDIYLIRPLEIQVTRVPRQDISLPEGDCNVLEMLFDHLTKDYINFMEEWTYRNPLDNSIMFDTITTLHGYESSLDSWSDFGSIAEPRSAFIGGFVRHEGQFCSCFCTTKRLKFKVAREVMTTISVHITVRSGDLTTVLKLGRSYQVTLRPLQQKDRCFISTGASCSYYFYVAGLGPCGNIKVINWGGDWATSLQSRLMESKLRK